MSPRQIRSVAVVCVDPKKAKVFRFSEERMERQTYEAVDGHFDALSESLAGERKILILGAQDARTRFWRRLQEWFPETASHVVGLEEVDHPNDQQIAQYALQYLRKPLERIG